MTFIGVGVLYDTKNSMSPQNSLYLSFSPCKTTNITYTKEVTSFLKFPFLNCLNIFEEKLLRHKAHKCHSKCMYYIHTDKQTKRTNDQAGVADVMERYLILELYLELVFNPPPLAEL